MNKGRVIIFSVLLTCCFLTNSVGAKSVGKDTYRMCKIENENDVLPFQKTIC